MNSQRFCPCLPSAGIKGLCHHIQHSFISYPGLQAQGGAENCARPGQPSRGKATARPPSPELPVLGSVQPPLPPVGLLTQRWHHEELPAAGSSHLYDPTLPNTWEVEGIHVFSLGGLDKAEILPPTLFLPMSQEYILKRNRTPPQLLSIIYI